MLGGAMRMCEWNQIGTIKNHASKDSMDHFLNTEAGSTWFFHRLLQALKDNDTGRIALYGCYTMSFRHMWE